MLKRRKMVKIWFFSVLCFRKHEKIRKKVLKIEKKVIAEQIFYRNY